MSQPALSIAPDDAFAFDDLDGSIDDGAQHDEPPPPASATMLVRLKPMPDGRPRSFGLHGVGDFKSGVWVEVSAEVAAKLATKRQHWENPRVDEYTNPLIFDVVSTPEEAEALDHDPVAEKKAEEAAKIGTAAAPAKLTAQPTFDPVADAKARAARAEASAAAAAEAARVAREDIERLTRR